MLERWCGIFLIALFLGGCGNAAERKSSYVEMAKDLIQDENFPRARMALRNALKIDPQDPYVLYLLGQVWEKEGNWPNALNLYSKAVELDATYQMATERLAQINSSAHDTHNQNQGHRKAGVELEPVVAKEGKRSQGLKAEVELGALAFAQQNQQMGETRSESLFEEHQHHPIETYTTLVSLRPPDKPLKNDQQDLEASIQLNPAQREILWNLFQLKLSRQQWSEAADLIIRLKNAGTSDYQVDLATGLLAVDRQQWDQAIQAFSRAQHANINALPPLAAIIKVYLERKQPEYAKAYLEKIIAQYPDHPFAAGLLGAVLWQLKDKTAAFSAYERQTQVHPTWVEAWKDWASLHWSDGKKAKAIDILKSALTQNPNSLVLLKSLASYSQANGQVDVAIRAYEAILRHNPTNILAANNLAYLLADKKGDYQSLETALSLTQDFETTTQNPLLLDTVAWVYYKTGLYTKAASIAKKALAKAPDHALINYHFGLMALKVGNRVVAKKHLEKAVQKPSELENAEEARRLLTKI